MTITVENKPKSGIICLEAVCSGPHGSLKHEGHKVSGEHIALFHNGYGDSAEPISIEQRTLFDRIVSNHEVATKGKHNIRVIVYER